MKQFIFAALLLLVPVCTLFSQPRQTTDRIIVVVNDNIILKSDVDNQVSSYLVQAQINGQQASFSRDLWFEMLETMVDNYVLLEKAKVDSITVSDDQVNQLMDARIQEQVQQAGGEAAIEEAYGQSILELREELRGQWREQMITQQVQEQKIRTINITRPEVRDFFESIPADSMPTVPEQVALSQIVVIPPPLEDAQQAAYQLAQQVRDSLVVHDVPFEELARRHSNDTVSANNGGRIPVTPMSDFVSSFSAAAAALEPGQISDIVETQFGYHIIRLNRRIGESIDTHHILIRVDQNSVDEDFARNKLIAIRDSVQNHGASFAEMAARHSEDEFTKNRRGRLQNPQTGEALIQLNQLDPALYRIALLLNEEGDISDPAPFTPQAQTTQRAFRIVRLDRHVQEHTANLEQDYNRLRVVALQQKQMRVLSEWLQELRDDVYIEYKIDVPSSYRQSNPDLNDIQAQVDTQ